MIDAITIARELTQAGIPSAHSETIATCIQQTADQGDHAIKEDIHELRAELRAVHATANRDELLVALRDFVSRFELVFDRDWEMTLCCLQDPEHLIAEEGTFIEPLVKDEGNNWGNRGSLLAAYRHLVTCMEGCNIQRSTDE